ncbi:hypothetical protein [Candidatus Poriferisocius sp.]|uniref:hypothetical protein n=1 Tax=Candidatus Poriferisocius sp. TaxID=3101276 RepID=UPI003B019CE5
MPPIDRRIKAALLVGTIAIAAIVGVVASWSSLGGGTGRNIASDKSEIADGVDADPRDDTTVTQTPVFPTEIPSTPSPPATVPPTPPPTAPAEPPATPAPEPTSTPVAAQEEDELWGCDYQSDRDPHRMVNFDQTADRLHSCGEETWQVFICTSQDVDRVDRVEYVDSVLGAAAAWFDWASGGQYDIDFSAGDDTIRVGRVQASPDACFTAARRTGWSESRAGAVILLDEPGLGPGLDYAGVGTCGFEVPEDDKQFDQTGRMVAIAVHSSGSREGIAVHELGHAQCWPHSHSGQTGTQYDNPADVMSFAHNWPVGTIAVNRYAAGWIHPNQVHIHQESARSYTLSPCCTEGDQLLALLPLNSSVSAGGFHSRWWAIEVRDPEDEWERGLAESGVGSELGALVHWVDQSAGWHGTGLNRRQTQVGGRMESGRDWSLVIPSLAVPGAELCLDSAMPSELVSCAGAHEWRIEVAASQSGGLTLTVAPGGE